MQYAQRRRPVLRAARGGGVRRRAGEDAVRRARWWVGGVRACGRAVSAVVVYGSVARACASAVARASGTARVCGGGHPTAQYRGERSDLVRGRENGFLYLGLDLDA